MRAPLVTWQRRLPVVRLLLLAILLFRAYVPAGFMPASGAPFRLALCPASVPMPAHHHHEGAHSHFEVCPFGSACTAGPAPQSPFLSARVPAATPAPMAIASWLGGIRLPSAHQSRGPPPAAQS